MVFAPKSALSKTIGYVVFFVAIISLLVILRLAVVDQAHRFTRIMVPLAALALLVSLILAYYAAANIRRLYKNLETSYSKIADSEAKFRAIVEQAGDAIIIFNNTNTITEVNSNACKMLGYNRSELLGLTLRQIVPAREADNQKQRVNLIENGQSAIFERLLMRKNGSELLTEINTQKVEGAGYISIVRDITERNKVQEALRKSEAKYRYLFNNYPAFIFMWDAETLRVLEVNDAVLKRYGYTQTEWANMKIFEFRPAEDQPHIMELAEKIKTDRQTTYTRKWRHVMKNGEVLVMDITTHPIEYNGRLAALSLARDITSHLHTESLLKQSEERHRAMIENISDAIFLMDENAQIFYQSPSVERIAGYVLEDSANTTVFEFVHPHDLPSALETFGIASQNLGHTINTQLRIRHKLGHFLWVEVSVVNLLNNPNVKAFIVCYRDISDRKSAEAEITALNESLEQKVTQRTAQLQNANDALESFAYSVSHDLRAPLRAIQGFNTIIEEEYMPSFDNEQKTLLGHIKANAQRMNAIIDDLLAFSRCDKAILKPEPVDMQQLFKKVWGDIKVIMPNHAGLETCPLPMALADPSLIEQVMVNLLSNAVKYSSKKQTPLVTLCYKQEEGMVTYLVKDNGAGFDMKYAHKLFAPFQRLHNANEFEGNGIGLLLVKRIIEKHGGKVHAAGIPGHGASFYFSLPAANNNMAQTTVGKNFN